MRAATLLAVLLAGVIPAAAPAAPRILGEEAALCMPGAPGPAILIQVSGLKDRDGSLRFELYPGNQEDFLADKNALRAAGKVFRRVIVPVPASGAATLCLGAPAPGRYSAVLIHDRDNKRSFNAFVDGVGFPGNPRLGLSKPPVSRALIDVGAGVTPVAIRLQYMRGLSVGPVRNPVDEPQIAVESAQ